MEMGLKILKCGDLRLALWLHSEQDPPVEQWAAALAQLSNVKDELKGDVTRIRMLVLSDGGAPNAMQRKDLFTELLEGKVKTAGVTTVLSNRLKRGIATAILWLNPNFRAFGPDQFHLALEHLDLEAYAREVLSALHELQKLVAPTQTLKLLAEAQSR